MKSLDHSKIYYKGLGQTNEEQCRKVLRDEYTFFGAFCLLAVLYAVAIWDCLNNPDNDKLDCLMIGMGSGLLLSAFLIVHSYINKYRLRLKEIKEGEE